MSASKYSMGDIKRSAAWLDTDRWSLAALKRVRSARPHSYTLDAYLRVVMEFEEFKHILEEQTGGRSQLSKDSHDVGRKLANLPD